MFTQGGAGTHVSRGPHTASLSPLPSPGLLGLRSVSRSTRDREWQRKDVPALAGTHSQQVRRDPGEARRARALGPSPSPGAADQLSVSIQRPSQ